MTTILLLYLLCFTIFVPFIYNKYTHHIYCVRVDNASYFRNVHNSMAQSVT